MPGRRRPENIYDRKAAQQIFLLQRRIRRMRRQNREVEELWQF